MTESSRSRAARPERRREALLAATRRVVGRSGFANATVHEITREAGASLGLLHYHFASKDEVVAEAFARIAQEDLEQLEAMSRRYPRAPDRLAAYVDLSEWADRESWRLWIDAWGEAVHAEPMRETLEGFQRGWRGLLSRVLEDGVREGAWVCDDPEDTAGCLVALIDGVGLHVTLHPDEVPPERARAWARRVVEGVLGVPLGALPAPPEPVRPATSAALRLPLRASDVGAEGRVPPESMLALLGEARDAWWRGRVEGAEAVLARVAIDYRRPLGRDDGPVTVTCALDRLGRSSIRTAERIESAGGELVALAEATLVVRDDETSRPRAMTGAEREALAA